MGYLSHDLLLYTPLDSSGQTGNHASNFANIENVMYEWLMLYNLFCASNVRSFNPFSAGTVFRLLIPTSKNGPHDDRIKKL